MNKLIISVTLIMTLAVSRVEAQLHFADVSTMNGGLNYTVRLYNCGSESIDLKDYSILEPRPMNRITTFNSQVLNTGESTIVTIGDPYYMVLMDEKLLVMYDYFTDIPEGDNWKYRSGFNINEWVSGKGGLPQYEMDCVYEHPQDQVSFGSMKTKVR